MKTLQDQFLIAMPAMGDPNFDGTVTYLCTHSDEGALGIIINRPLDIHLSEVFRQLSFDVLDDNQANQPVLSGGPVQPGMGVGLHRAEHDRIAGHLSPVGSQPAERQRAEAVGLEGSDESRAPVRMARDQN